jgi:hypothetical protein
MGVIDPYSPFQRKWNVFTLLIISYNALLIPYQLGFWVEISENIIILNYFFDLFLIADILRSFYIGYFHEGLLVTDLKKIKLNYLKGRFSLDLLASLPFDFIALYIGMNHFGGIEFLVFFRIPKLLRVLRILEYFEPWEKDFRLNPSVIRIVKLFLCVVLNAHWIACGWFYIAVVEYAKGLSPWIVSRGIADSPVYDQYINSLYWSLTTMTTVGYGDITPSTPLETAFTMVAMVVGVSIYAYIVGNMATLVANLDRSAQLFRERMDSINDYMRFREIPPALQFRVRCYYDYVWARNKGVDEDDILSGLPHPLRVELNLFLHREVLAKVPLFQGVEQGFINSLVMMLKPMISVPGDYIIRYHEVGKEMFFITNGQVDVVGPDGETIYATLGEGSFFGEIALLFHEKRTASVISSRYCDLFRLDKEDMEAVVADYPEVQEQMLSIANERYKKNPLDPNKDKPHTY